MRYLDEFADPDVALRLVGQIRKSATRRWTVMEVCGGQTHSLVRNGIDQLLAGAVEFVHGPGCPVCVTPLETIDRALAIASRPEVTLCSFGDMLRVPGSHADLFEVRARGGDVRVVYSPLDALRVAEAEPEREVVFFAVGFETTAPANAMAVVRARDLGVANFSMIVSHVLVPPAMAAVLSAPRRRVEGFLAAGHVCTVMGTQQYDAIVEQFHVPVVVAGFEALDLLDATWRVVVQLEAGEARLENAYTRAVGRAGNERAQRVLSEVFEVCDRTWRGIGHIPASGWRLSQPFRDFDAELRFDVASVRAEEAPDCRAGEVLQGLVNPDQCAAFGTTCTPRNPLGATMVSSEGACAAYYRYRRSGVTAGVPSRG